MIYDCFTFLNEWDLLELRLIELDPVVNMFVVIESPITFSGQEKEVYFCRAKEFCPKGQYRRLAKYFHKIMVLVPDSIDTNSAWEREYASRRVVKQLLPRLEADDIVMLSDVDEIPRRLDVRDLTLIHNAPLSFRVRFFYYNMGWIKPVHWASPLVLNKALIESSNIHELFLNRHSQGNIGNVGWHLSYFGGAKMIQEKLRAFSHQEYNKEPFTNIDFIQEAIDTGRDLFNRGATEDCVENEFPADMPIGMKRYPEIFEHFHSKESLKTLKGK
jgi:beta-1,4-mannosyl-glycoprotein beta-1,4-N-acetylglucosaminyltransferase